MKVIKRNGEEVLFDKNRIIIAVTKASNEAAPMYRMNKYAIDDVADSVEKQVNKLEGNISVETIQDMVEKSIMEHRAFEVAQLYVRYRYKKTLARRANTTDDKILSLIELKNEEIKQENSNKNSILASTQRDYMAGEVSKDISQRLLLPEDVVQAHNDGRIHFHDMDYFAQHTYNCCLWNLEGMLQNGTVISGTKIDKPHSFATACNVATQIAAQVASNQYGGQTFTLSHLAPFVDVSRQKYREKIREEFTLAGVSFTEEQVNKVAEERVRSEVKAGVQTIQYQVITLQTTNGQAPFISVFMCLSEVPEGQLREDLALIIEEMLKQRIQGVKNAQGVYVTPAFPKLLYCLDETNDHGCKYDYLTALACECTAKRMVPDYISAKKMRELKGEVYPCMGCRSFLTPDRFTDAGIGNIADALDYKEGEHKYYGRFNQGVVTINLVDVACASGGDEALFWDIFDERLELCHKALRCRHDRLLGTTSDIAPILWQNGAIARLKPGEVIDRLLYDGYSTISLGYAGLYECTYYMTGKSHTSEKGKPFALLVMKELNDKCAKWKAEENIDYSVYGTPLESTTYKFAKCLRDKYGEIEGVTDHNYITNSYHVNVREKIDAFTKLKFESEFQELSPGGAISYVEVPNMQDNLEAVRAVIDYIRDNIMYAELNTKSDYCSVCGYDGEIQITEDEGKLIWECPNCHNRDQTKMSVARRTCGYIGTQYWNQGRTQEIRDRVLHL